MISMQRLVSRVSRSVIALAMLLAGMGIGMGLLSATARDAEETVYACVNKNTGAPRIVAEGTNCKKHEHGLAWSVGNSSVIEPLTGEDIQDGSLSSNDVSANYARAGATNNPPNVVFTNQGFTTAVTVEITIPHGDDGSSVDHAVLISGDMMIHCWDDTDCAGTVRWHLRDSLRGVFSETGRVVYPWTLPSYDVGTLPVNEIVVLPSGSHSLSLEVAYKADTELGSLEVDSARLTAVDLGKQP